MKAGEGEQDITAESLMYFEALPRVYYSEMCLLKCYIIHNFFVLCTIIFFLSSNFYSCDSYSCVQSQGKKEHLFGKEDPLCNDIIYVTLVVNIRNVHLIT